MIDLSPGYYKVRPKSHKPLGRRQPERVQMLRVVGYGPERRYYYDNDPTGFTHEQLGDITWHYDIFPMKDEPDIEGVEMTIKFRDRLDKDYFIYTVRDAWALRNLFEKFSWLRKPFNFLPNRSRIVKK